MNAFGFAIFYLSIANLQGRIEESLVNLSSESGRIGEKLVNFPLGVHQQCESGYRKDPLNCHLFYHCGGYSHRTPLSCGILMFNDITKTCDWPTRVMQLRPECKDNYKLRRKAKTQDEMGRLDEGEMMRHFGGDIAVNVIRQQKNKQTSGHRFDFRGKIVKDSEPMIRIRKYKNVNRRIPPRRVRMLRRRLVNKYPTQSVQQNKNMGTRKQKINKGGRKQKINIAPSLPNNQHKILNDDSVYSFIHSTNPINRIQDSKQQLEQPQSKISRIDDSSIHLQHQENRIHRFDDSLLQTPQNPINSKLQSRPTHTNIINGMKSIIKDTKQRVTSTQTSFSSHTPVTVSTEKYEKNTPNKLKATEQLDTLHNGDLNDWLHNKIFNEDKAFNRTSSRDDITEVFKEQPRVRVLKDQPRIRIPRPRDFKQPRIRIKTLKKGSKTRVFTPNFHIPAPRFTGKEQPITLNDAFQKRAGAVERIHSNVQVSSPTFGLKMKNKKYLETKSIREKEKTDDRDITNKQHQVSIQEGRETGSFKKTNMTTNINLIDSEKLPEDTSKIREEIKNEIQKMLEKAKVNTSNQDHISTCITHYLKCKVSQSKGPCLTLFNSCSGAQILLPDLYETN